MQDRYVSLNPDNTAREEKAIRRDLYLTRRMEAQGGPASVMFGGQLGLTAAVFSYARLKAAKDAGCPLRLGRPAALAQIGMSFLLFYMAGHSYVMSKFGNEAQYKYLLFNRMAIQNGSKPIDQE